MHDVCVLHSFNMRMLKMYVEYQHILVEWNAIPFSLNDVLYLSFIQYVDSKKTYTLHLEFCMKRFVSFVLSSSTWIIHNFSSLFFLLHLSHFLPSIYLKSIYFTLLPHPVCTYLPHLFNFMKAFFVRFGI